MRGGGGALYKNNFDRSRPPGELSYTWLGSWFSLLSLTSRLKQFVALNDIFLISDRKEELTCEMWLRFKEPWVLVQLFKVSAEYLRSYVLFEQFCMKFDHIDIDHIPACTISSSLHWTESSSEPYVDTDNAHVRDLIEEWLTLSRGVFVTTLIDVWRAAVLVKTTKIEQLLFFGD